MIKVDQTKFPVRGNCWRACIASLIEIDIDDMPTFEDMEDQWLVKTRSWLRTQGFEMHVLSKQLVPKGLAIASGTSPRHSQTGHSIIVYEGELYHDPHPDRTGILDLDYYYQILPLKQETPAKPKQSKRLE